MSAVYHAPQNPLMKTCSMCLANKPISEFYKCTRCKDGYKSLCKCCHDKRPIPIKRLVQLTFSFEVKCCNRCGKEKPLHEFYDNGGGRKGKQGICIACFSTRHKERYSKHIPLPDVKPGYKICRRCRIEKPLSAFFKQTSSKDRYAYSCKECKRHHDLVVARERTLARSSRYYQANKEKAQAINRQNW